MRHLVGEKDTCVGDDLEDRGDVHLRIVGLDRRHDIVVLVERTLLSLVELVVAYFREQAALVTLVELLGQGGDIYGCPGAVGGS